MRSLLVVDAQPVLGDVLNLLDALEHIGVQDLVAVRAVEPLDVGVLVGLPVTADASTGRTPWDDLVGGFAPATGRWPQHSHSDGSSNRYHVSRLSQIAAQRHPTHRSRDPSIKPESPETCLSIVAATRLAGGWVRLASVASLSRLSGQPHFHQKSNLIRQRLRQHQAPAVGLSHHQREAKTQAHPRPGI